MNTYTVGQKVEFHGEWPFVISRGVILSIEERPREFSRGTETGAVIEWEPLRIDGHEWDRQTFVPFWNQRLRPSRG